MVLTVGWVMERERRGQVAQFWAIDQILRVVLEFGLPVRQ